MAGLDVQLVCSDESDVPEVNLGLQSPELYTHSPHLSRYLLTLMFSVV